MDSMFRIIERLVKDTVGAEKYIEELDSDAKFIKQMDYPGDLSDGQRYEKIKNDFYGLQLLNARYIRVPILAACRRWGSLENKDVQKLVDCLVVFFFKFKFINDGTTEDVRHIANQVTKKIDGGEDISKIICTVLVDEDAKDGPEKRIKDESFEKNFPDKMFKLNDAIAKYILKSMEIYTRNEMKKERLYPDHNFELEHILPKRHQKYWDKNEFLGQDLEGMDISKYKNRLGNLTLLSGKWNRGLGAKEFSVKRDNDNGYANSDFEINRKYLKDYKEWTAVKLENREEALCNIASKVWSLDKYDSDLKSNGYDTAAHK